MNDHSLYGPNRTPEPDYDQPNSRTQRSLASIKRDRRLLDSNAQALANRISLLQKEEAKIWGNLEKAKIKAKEAFFMKKRDENRMKERFAQFQQNQVYVQQNNSNIAILRKQRESGIQLLREAMKQQKHKEMLAAKRQSEIIMIKKRDLESQIIQEKQQKMLAIKKEEILATFKRKAYFEDKVKKLKHNYVREVEEEEEQKVLKELEILEMEKKEMELVQRIQQTRVLQKQVYNDLEAMFSEPQAYTEDTYRQIQGHGQGHDQGQGPQINQDYRASPEFRGVSGLRGKSLDGRVAQSQQLYSNGYRYSPSPLDLKQQHRQNMNRLYGQ